MIARPRHAWIGVTLALVLAGLASSAAAQLSGSVEADSDYRLRGVSFSDGRPVASLNVAYDNLGGFYAGASVTAVATSHAGPEVLGDLVFAGYAGRINALTSWDAGVSNQSVSIWLDQRYKLNYTEVYAGLTRGGLSAHLYYSPSYLGGGVQTLYGEVNGAVRPAARWRLFAHVGVLTPIAGHGAEYASRARFDARAGVAREIRNFELRLAWTTISPGVEFPIGYPQARNALVLSAACNF